MKTAVISFGLFLLTVLTGSMVFIVWSGQLPWAQPITSEPLTFDTTASLITEPTDQASITSEASDRTVFSSTGLPIQFSYPSDWILSPETTTTSSFAQLTDYTPTDEDAFLNRIPGHKLEVILIDLQPNETPLDWAGNPKKHTVVEVAGISSWQVQSNASAAASISLLIPSPDDKNQFVAFALSGPESNPAELTELFNTFVNSIELVGS